VVFGERGGGADCHLPGSAPCKAGQRTLQPFAILHNKRKEMIGINPRVGGRRQHVFCSIYAPADPMFSPVPYFCVFTVAFLEMLANVASIFFFSQLTVNLQ